MIKLLLRGLSIFVLTFGTIGSFVVANNYGKSLQENIYTKELERDYVLTIGIFLGCIIFILIISSILIALERLYELSEETNYYIKKCNDFIDFNKNTMNTNYIKKDKKRNKNIEQWECKHCGVINPSYYSTCFKCNKTK